MLIEFDTANDRTQKKLLKKAKKLLDKYSSSYQVASSPEDQEKLWKIRNASASVIGHSEGGVRSLPIIEDGIVPPEHLQQYMEGLYAIFAETHLQPAVWGHAGDGHLHTQPFLDLSQVGDRQRLFKLMDEYYDLVISLGGSISGSHGEGRLSAPYLEKQYGKDFYIVFQKIKQIFDPYGTLNPGVKVNVTIDSVKPLVRSHYTLDHLYNHMPRS